MATLLAAGSVADVTALPGRPGPDPRWRRLFPDQAALEEHVNGFQVGEHVPGGMGEVLRVARLLLIYSYVEYEFALVAVTWALLALEEGLRVCLGARDKPGKELGWLLGQAKKRGLITKGEFKALDGARDLRNHIVHGELRPSFEPSAAVEMVAAIHDALSEIYARAAGNSPVTSS